MNAAPGQYGEIFDRGYRHYEGARLGPAQGIWALARYSMARAIGLRRSWTAKIIPILLYGAVGIPVLIAIGIRAFVPGFQFMDYAGFFGATFLLEGMFVALIAPEMMSTDRHDNLLPLYFSRPISRSGYVLAKLLGAALLTLSISLLPAVVFWLGNGLLADQPLVEMRESLDDLGRIVVAGTLIAIYLGAIGLMISSFTSRKSVAVGIIVLGFVLSESLSFSITEAFGEDVPLARWAFVLSPSRTIVAMVDGLFQVPGFEGMPGPAPSLPEAIAVMVTVVVFCTLVMFAWYQRRD